MSEPSTYTYEMFRALPVDGHMLVMQDAAYEATIEEVKQLGSGMREGGAFSVLINVSPDAPVQQGLFTLRHEDAGSFEIFAVPLAKDEQGVQLEAIFT